MKTKVKKVDERLLCKLEKIGVDTTFAPMLGEIDFKIIKIIMVRNAGLEMPHVAFLVQDYMDSVFEKMMHEN